jgi:hypothetical protein
VRREEGEKREEEGRGKREEGRGKREEGRGQREEGRGKREEGRGKREEREEKRRGKRRERKEKRAHLASMYQMFKVSQSLVPKLQVSGLPPLPLDLLGLLLLLPPGVLGLVLLDGADLTWVSCRMWLVPPSPLPSLPSSLSHLPSSPPSSSLPRLLSAFSDPPPLLLLLLLLLPPTFSKRDLVLM